jgi:hypothetical protein
MNRRLCFGQLAVTFIRHFVILSLLGSLLLVACSLSQDVNASFTPDSFLVRIVEVTTDNQPRGVMANDCIVVSSDGRFHLERRQQVIPSPSARLRIFESSLDSSQFANLQNLLQSERVRALQGYVTPKFPLTMSWVSDLDVQISRGDQVQRVGYWTWRGGKTGLSPESTPNNIKQIWQVSQVALQPLVEWFHQVKSVQLQPSTAQPTMCGGEGDQD